MAKLTAIHFYPERAAIIGLAVIGLGLAALLPFVFLLESPGGGWICLNERDAKRVEVAPIAFSLDLAEKAPALPIPDLQGEMTFSFDPPRPIGLVEGKRVLVRTKNGSSSKRVVLPCRLDLEFQRDQLRFASGPSPFWVELSQVGRAIEGRVFISSVDGERIEGGRFTVEGQEPPVQGASEFVERSPFRQLGEAHWWGRDQFLGLIEGGERLEIGTGEFIELREGDWLIWRAGKWEKGEGPALDAPIARIQSVSSRAMVLEGWGLDGYIRLSLAMASPIPFKMRSEDLLSAIRIRSEKQISCMLEKQCIVLKAGDWVLKQGGRWRILRKKEEKDAFINGKLLGEMFVFEQIAQKQGQKVVQGRLYNLGRTQMVSIEMNAQSVRKMKKGKAS